VITVIATLGIIAVFGSPEARADRFITELTRYDEDSLPLTDWSFQLAKEGSDSVECVVTSVTPGTDFSTVQENFARLESAFSRESDFVLMLMDDEESFNRRMGIYDLQEDQEEVG
jgi:hypothetical protein